MRYFAEDYAEARGLFLTAAMQAGAAIETITHPDARSPAGGPLCIDVARVGRQDATNVLLTISGVHGVEGYPGSAAQVQLLHDSQLDSLPDHVAIVFVHALNPYAWSRDSQRDEDGVDINRNFVDFARLDARPSELHEKFAAILLELDEMSFGALDRTSTAILALRREAGAKPFMDALVGGQYLMPQGIKYGGTKPAWSNVQFRSIVRHYLRDARRVACLDWHTGIGQYGRLFPLCFCPHGSHVRQLTSLWWGGMIDRSSESWSVTGDDTPAPDITGSIWQGLLQETSHAEVAGGVAEFGTVPFDNILQAAVLDHWLAFKASYPETAYWRAQLRTLFAPREPGWERAVAWQAERICAATLSGLSAWT
jgi:hypothetical protein